MPPHAPDALRWYDVVLVRVIPPAAAFLIKALMLSCRVVRVEGIERTREALSNTNGGAVYATWHQRMSYHFHHFGSRHVTTMISRSRADSSANRMGVKSAVTNPSQWRSRQSR